MKGQPRERPRATRRRSFGGELDADEAAALCGCSDAAMGARDGRAIAALLSSESRAHVAEHARELHEALRPIVAVFARSPATERVFRRFLPAALDPARATGDEVAVTEIEVTVQVLVRSMVEDERGTAELLDLALSMLDPLVGTCVDDVLAALLAQMVGELHAEAITSMVAVGLALGCLRSSAPPAPAVATSSTTPAAVAPTAAPSAPAPVAAARSRSRRPRAPRSSRQATPPRASPRPRTTGTTS